MSVVFAELDDQLKAADARCELLDKQLDYMRRMLNEAESEKRLAYERSEQMVQHLLFRSHASALPNNSTT